MWQIILLLILAGCAMETNNMNNQIKIDDITSEEYDTVIFAGGCFWCMEGAFQGTEGVIDVVSGYTGGLEENADYDKVSTGNTGHFEAIKIYYDKNIISYDELLSLFWRQIDPTDEGGQFSDRGPQYKTAIFYQTETQKALAELSKESIQHKFEKPIATLILQEMPFYEAEEYHQDYFLKRTAQYKLYEKGSGRKDYIEKTWENDLTDLQKDVALSCGTEPAFNNEYWNNKEEGIYVDIITGEPLFSSKDKFDSGTGWPSFTKLINNSNILEKEDTSLGTKRIEVRTTSTHLGHVFDDGPNDGPRYCINSASLKFIPKEEMKEKGYEEYLEFV